MKRYFVLFVVVFSIAINVFVFLCTIWFMHSDLVYNVFVRPTVENIMNGMKRIYNFKKGKV